MRRTSHQTIDRQSGTRSSGKERDAESGLDYFGARYYGSSMGRWMSSDWAGTPEAVPYSSLENPQSLNLYAYVNNNPLNRTDPDGHMEDRYSMGGDGWGTSDGMPNGVGYGRGMYNLLQGQIDKMEALMAAAGVEAAQQQGIGAIAGYPETGSNAWRAANDQVFTNAAYIFDQDNTISPGSPMYITPMQLKAQAMIESGGSPQAFATDPLQVNVAGDWSAQKAAVTGLQQGQTMTPAISAAASLKWLLNKATIYDSSGNDIGFRSMHDALRNYNGNTRVYPNQGGLQHRDWYANQVISLSQ